MHVQGGNTIKVAKTKVKVISSHRGTFQENTPKGSQIIIKNLKV